MNESGVTETQFPSRLGEQSFSTPQGKKSRGRFIFLVLIILAVVGFIGFRYFAFKNNTSESATVTPTVIPTEIVFPTDTPMPQESPTPEPSKTPTPKPTVNPVDKATGLDRSTLSIEVQNGSGEVGVASKASDFLKSLGYKVVSIGNADTFDYQGTSVFVKDSEAKFLPLIKDDLSKQYTIGSTSATLSASSSALARVIVGKQ